MNMRYKLCVFDFDGTLGDTSECVIASFQGALAQNNLPIVNRDEIVQLMGISLPAVFKKLTNNTLDDTMYDTLVADYRMLYKTYLTQKTGIFPGVKKALSNLKERGAICTIATSKKTEFAILSCQYLKIDQYIDLYIGDDKVKNKKPHPEMLERTLSHFGVDIASAVMIGDATTDIEMGQAIGMDTIAVTWGAHSEKLLKQQQPTYIVHTAEEMKKIVTS